MSDNKRLQLNKDKLLPLLLFCVVWLPRVLSPSPFVGADEPAWAYRSLRFLQALLNGDLAHTFQTGHPGVVTMWAGAIGATAHQLGQGEPLGTVVADLPTLDGEFDPFDLDLLRRVSLILPAACVVTATFDTALLLVAFALLWRTFDRVTALLALAFLAFNPFYLALSRQLHPESLLASTMLLSVVALLAFFRGQQRRMLILSGIAAGLAVLSKVHALFLLPSVGLLTGWHFWASRPDDPPGSLLYTWRRWATTLILWCLVMVATVFALWPALWVEPLSVVRGIARLSAFFSQSSSTRTSSFFFGQTVAQAGALFYPIAMLFRTTPLTTIGFLLALVTAFFSVREQSTPARSVSYLLSFVLLFIAFLSLWGKKYPRYALVALLGLDILAAWGWRALYKRLPWRRWQRALFALAFLQCGFVLSFHPHYLAHYNPLVGGLRQAIRVLPVGGGEGTDLAADYLAAKNDAANLRVATWSVPSLAPYFPGDLVPPRSPLWQTADYLLVYIGDAQEQTLPDVDLSSLELEQAIQVRNTDYAWVYRNRYYRDPLREIESRAKEGDALLLDTSSVLTRHMPNSIGAYVLSGDESENQVIALLAAINFHSQQVWLMTHPNAPMSRWLPWQIETHTLLLGEWAFPGCQLAAHQWLPDMPFEPARPVSLEIPAPIRLDGNLALTALALAAESVEYRQKLGIVLHWETITKTRPAYAVSLRLVDETGYRWAQTDTLLKTQDDRDTTAWLPAEKATTQHLLNIPAGMPPGPYRLIAVPYTAAGAQVVAISDGAGQAMDREIALASITVRRATLPPSQDELPITSEMADSEAELGDLKVLGYDLAARELSASPVPLVLCWQALRPPAEDYQATLQLQGPADWTRQYPLSHHSYPTSHWQAGEVVCTPLTLAGTSNLPTGTYRLTVNLTDQEGQPVAAQGILLAKVQVQQAEHTSEIPPIQHPLVEDFGEVARLLGYDLDSEIVAPADGVELTLYWQARSETAVSVNYTAFTHLLDSQGQIAAQHDSWPSSGARPTTGWVKGEVITDRHLLTFTDAHFRGTGQIEIGLYNQATGERLTLADGGDHVLLPTRITVQD